MADEELKKLLGEDSPPAEKTDTPATHEDDDLKKKEEQKANLEKAILEAQDTLRKTRKELKDAKTTTEDEDVPKINLDDPSAKAWDRHISEKTAPMQVELEKEKEEIRTFALREFLSDKPNLSRNPEKLKEMMGMYERVKSSSERTREGVINDLETAYAATHRDELLTIARNQRVETAQADIILSDIAVSRGATSYSNPKDPSPNLSEDDKAILSKWGMSPSEWIEYKKKYG